MGNYTIFDMFENRKRSRQARNFTTNVPKILDFKSSSERIIFRKLTLRAPVYFITDDRHQNELFVIAWNLFGGNHF